MSDDNLDYEIELYKDLLREKPDLVNMGLGLVAIVAAGDEQATHAALRERGLESWTVGGIERGEGEATCEVVP